MCACLLPWAAAQAGQYDELAAALNAARGHGVACEGRNVVAAPPLAFREALAQAAAGLPADGGGDLNAALDHAGYRSRRSFLLRINGLADTAALARYADRSFCAALRAPDVSEIGIHQQGSGNGTVTTIVLAFPLALPAADARDESRLSRRVLELVNQARAVARLCGKRRFAAAPPLAWDERLAAASVAYATDLARYKYLSHTGRDGSQPGLRATRAGYAWKAVGENLAAGQVSPEEVTAGWVASPGHCANLMSPAFSVMGAGYAVNPDDRMGVYWAQLFAAPR
ncbi:MAG: hypothetical protein JWN73_3713 [Betaproteobacteria bacterium]|nr:hypothetical protein [Betaproteobacteria bacterium]